MERIIQWLELRFGKHADMSGNPSLFQLIEPSVHKIIEQEKTERKRKAENKRVWDMSQEEYENYKKKLTNNG